MSLNKMIRSFDGKCVINISGVLICDTKKKQYKIRILF